MGDWEGIAKTWIDSFHNGTAIIFPEDKRREKDMSFLDSYAYVTSEIEQHWGWRTNIELFSDDELVISAFNVSPEGRNQKQLKLFTRG